MENLNIYKCTVVDIEDRHGTSELYVLGRSFTEVEHAIKSDPNVELFSIELIAENKKAIRGQDEVTRGLVNAASFKAMTEQATAGYNGLDVYGLLSKIKYLESENDMRNVPF